MNRVPALRSCRFTQKKSKESDVMSAHKIRIGNNRHKKRRPSVLEITWGLENRHFFVESSSRVIRRTGGATGSVGTSSPASASDTHTIKQLSEYRVGEFAFGPENGFRSTHRQRSSCDHQRDTGAMTVFAKLQAERITGSADTCIILELEQ